jgi:hypothetical protein
MPESEVPTILGRALRGELSDREIALIGLSEEAKHAITRLIELSPALEEGILNVADLVYRDGLDSAENGYGIIGACTGIEVAPESPELETDICGICHNRHKASDTFTAGTFTLIAGHEYEITTKTSQQKYPRIWRMGFMGGLSHARSELQFSARGPDRTHGSQYGGTQTISADMIISVREVEHLPHKRHVGRRY